MIPKWSIKSYSAQMMFFKNRDTQVIEKRNHATQMSAIWKWWHLWYSYPNSLQLVKFFVIYNSEGSFRHCSHLWDYSNAHVSTQTSKRRSNSSSQVRKNTCRNLKNTNVVTWKIFWLCMFGATQERYEAARSNLAVEKPIKTFLWLLGHSILTTLRTQDASQSYFQAGLY